MIVFDKINPEIYTDRETTHSMTYLTIVDKSQ